MKLQLNIDQKASLIAGLDAPHSTMIVEIAPADISPEDRALVMPQYDVASGRLGGNPDLDRAAAGWPTLPDAVMPSVLANTGTHEALAAVHSYAESIRSRQAAYDAALAAHQVTLAERAAADAAKQAADDAAQAEARAGLIAGTWRITGIGDTYGSQYICVASPTTGAGAYDHKLAPGDDIAPMIAAYQAAQAAAKAAAAAQAAEEAAQKAARQINGRDVLTWDVDGGTVDQTTEPGVPYDSHRLAHNWLATVSHDAKAPGKLAREFWSGGPKQREIPSNLAVGDYIEGGSKDKKDRKSRSYVRVLEITDTALTLRESSPPGANPPDIAKDLARLAEIRALDAVPA